MMAVVMNVQHDNIVMMKGMTSMTGCVDHLVSIKL